jgi:hypothetical protein
VPGTEATSTIHPPKRDRAFSSTKTPEVDIFDPQYADVFTAISMAVAKLPRGSTEKKLMEDKFLEILQILISTLADLYTILHVDPIGKLIINQDHNSDQVMAVADATKISSKNEQIEVTKALKIHLQELELLAECLDKGNLEGIANFRYSLAQEIYHLYIQLHYPTTHEETLRANSESKNGDYGIYARDRGEVATRLFGLKYILNRKETDPGQALANQTFATKRGQYESVNLRYYQGKAQKNSVVQAPEQVPDSEPVQKTRFQSLFESIRRLFN